MVLIILKALQQSPVAILITTFVGFGGFLFGYDTGAISGIISMEYFKRTFGHIQSDETYHINSNDKSLIVSTLLLGTVFGALLGYPCGDFLGRRLGLILACIIFLMGISLQTAATAVPLFVIGRVVTGLGIGILSCIVPMYQSECAPKLIRGAIVSTYQWCTTFGILIGAIINNATKDIPTHACYRIPIGIQLIWGSLFTIGMFFIPESPRYLVLKGHIDEAYKSQARLTSNKIDDPQIEVDIKELIENTKLMKIYGSNSYADCFKMGQQKNFLRTLLGIFLLAWQQLIGINFIFYYGTNFFSSLGFSNPFILMIAFNAVGVGMGIIGILIIDKVGRRYILIIGALGMSICEYIIAIVGTTVQRTNYDAQNTVIAFSCLYVAIFAATWNGGPWVIVSELFPIPLQAKCMSLSTASSWLFSFIVAYAIPFMMNQDKGNMKSQIFFVWGSTCLACMIFSIFCVWETKGLSLEQVNYLVRNSSPIKSAQFNKQLQTTKTLDDDMMTSSELIDSSNKSLDVADEIPQISVDTNNFNENTSLLGKIK